MFVFRAASFPEYKKFHVSSTEERDMMKDPGKVACRIFVGNLPTDDMDRKDLKDLFGKFGIVTGYIKYLNLLYINRLFFVWN